MISFNFFLRVTRQNSYCQDASHHTTWRAFTGHRITHMHTPPVFHELIQLVNVARLDVVLVTKLLDVLAAIYVCLKCYTKEPDESCHAR